MHDLFCFVFPCHKLTLLLILRPDRGDREEFRGRGGFRRGRGRGFGGGRSEEDGFDRFGKREFERHSGSDRT